MAKVQVRYEQAVYGSFPFWDRGYALLADSPGCRPEWLSGFRDACQRYGERPSGIAGSSGMFALRLPRGPWMIVGVGAPGRDDRGRPGALAFHALFVSPRDYRKAECVPFEFVGLCRDDWTAETRSLPTGSVAVECKGSVDPATDVLASRIASALTRGGRVAIQADTPIDMLAQEVWRALPPSARGRASVATWAFGNGNRFDLVALPRLAGVTFDASYVDPAAIDGAGDPASLAGARALHPGRRLVRAWPYVGAAALFLGAATGLALRERKRDLRTSSGSPAETAPASTPSRVAPPDRSTYATPERLPEERQRVTEALLDIAQRFGVDDVEAGAFAGDPASLMVAIAGSLRYRGPLLSDLERARLARDPDTTMKHERSLALEWDRRVRRFVPDRPFPEDFERGPLRWQIDTLAWSFHMDDSHSAGSRTAPEVVHALGETLTVDVPLNPTSLTIQYPILAGYRAFLGRLPRR